MSEIENTADYVNSDLDRRTVYAVSSGEYSDYQVHFMCESETDAEAIAKRLSELDRYDGYVVESFPLFTEGSNLRPRPLYTAAGKLGLMDVKVEERFTTYGHFGRRPRINHLEHLNEIRAEGGDRDACIKAVKDRLAALLARPSDA